MDLFCSASYSCIRYAYFFIVMVKSLCPSRLLMAYRSTPWYNRNATWVCRRLWKWKFFFSRPQCAMSLRSVLLTALLLGSSIVVQKGLVLLLGHICSKDVGKVFMQHPVHVEILQVGWCSYFASLICLMPFGKIIRKCFLSLLPNWFCGFNFKC